MMHSLSYSVFSTTRGALILKLLWLNGGIEEINDIKNCSIGQRVLAYEKRDCSLPSFCHGKTDKMGHVQGGMATVSCKTVEYN